MSTPFEKQKKQINIRRHSNCKCLLEIDECVLSRGLETLNRKKKLETQRWKTRELWEK